MASVRSCLMARLSSVTVEFLRASLLALRLCNLDSIGVKPMALDSCSEFTDMPSLLRLMPVFRIWVGRLTVLAFGVVPSRLLSGLLACASAASGLRTSDSEPTAQRRCPNFIEFYGPQVLRWRV